MNGDVYRRAIAAFTDELAELDEQIAALTTRRTKVANAIEGLRPLLEDDEARAVPPARPTSPAVGPPHAPDTELEQLDRDLHQPRPWLKPSELTDQRIAQLGQRAIAILRKKQEPMRPGEIYHALQLTGEAGRLVLADLELKQLVTITGATIRRRVQIATTT